MPWVCPECGTNNEDSAVMCCVCDYYYTPTISDVADKQKSSSPPTPIKTPEILTKEIANTLCPDQDGTLVISDGYKYICEHAFEKRQDIKRIIISDSVKNIGKYAFCECASLASVTFSENCQLLSIGCEAFRGCMGLTSITVPNSVICIFAGAFSGCSSLVSMTIPFVGEKAGIFLTHKTYQYPFGHIFGTTDYQGGTAVTQFYYKSSFGSRSTRTIEDTTYYIPSTLRSVTVTGGDGIMQGAFYNCFMLKSVTVSDAASSIGADNCIIYTSTRMDFIGEDAFFGCVELASLTIPNSVTHIGEKALRECYSLTSITFKGTKAQWKAITKGCDWKYNTGRYVVHCTDGDIPKWRS